MVTRRLFAAACAAALAPLAHAASAPRLEPYSYRFEWLEAGTGGPDAHPDPGALAATPAAMRGGSIVIRRRVAVRIDGPGPFARLSVALGVEAPGCIVRLNGVALSTIPRVIEANHRVGGAVVHQLEISVPRGVPPGAFMTSLQWQAEPV